MRCLNGVNTMSASSLLIRSAAIAALAVSAGAAGAKACYHFDGQAPDASYAIDGPPIAIGIGEIRVRPLVLDGVVMAADNPANRFFKVAATQQMAGGQAPEMYAKNASIQMLPRDEVHQITLRYSHQPGAEGVRAAMVEVNGVRHDWQGSLHKLDGKQIGTRHPARFAVRQGEGKGENGWISGELKLTSKDGIKSFTLGAAELRLDDVCFDR
jgi:hypothetical protein